MLKLFSLILSIPNSKFFFGEWITSFKKFKEFADAVKFSWDDGDVTFTPYNIKKFCELLGTDKVAGFLSAWFDMTKYRAVVDAAVDDDDAAQELADMINNFLSQFKS